MKTLLLLFIISITTFIQAQEVKSSTVFYYKYTFMRDSLDKDRKFEETMVLLSDGKESIYKSFSKCVEIQSYKATLTKEITL